MEENKVSISIIIPCRNEEKYIAACLDAILAFKLPKDSFEVIVVDGVSTDSTSEIVRKYSQKHAFIRLLSNPGRIVPSAMNAAIKASSGKYIVRLDAHTEYPSSYVSECLSLLEETGAANAGGRVVTIPNGSGPWAIPIAEVTAHRFGVGAGAFRVGAKAGFVDTVPFGTFRREVFAEVGFFDEQLTRNQDNEFNDRLRKAGYKIAFDPKIQSRYKNKATLAGLLHQAFFTGMWNIYTLKLFPYTFKWRRFIPFAFVLYILSIPFVSAMPRIFNIYWLPAVLYLVVAVGISFTMPHSLAIRTRIALTFISYHLTYGAGTFWGIINITTGIWKKHLGMSLTK